MNSRWGAWGAWGEQAAKGSGSGTTQAASGPLAIGPYGGGYMQGAPSSPWTALKDARVVAEQGKAAALRTQLTIANQKITYARTLVDHAYGLIQGADKGAQFATTKAIVDDASVALDAARARAAAAPVIAPAPTPVKPPEAPPGDPRVTSYPPQGAQLPPEYGPPPVAATAGPLTPGQMKVGLGVGLVVVLVGVYLLGRNKR